MRHAGLSTLGFALLSLAFVVAPPVRAQEPPPEEKQDEQDPVELMRQIRRNMMKIEDELAKFKASPAANDAIKNDISQLPPSLDKDRLAHKHDALYAKVRSIANDLRCNREYDN